MEYHTLSSDTNGLIQLLDDYTRTNIIPSECVEVENLSKLKSGDEIFYQSRPDLTCFRNMMFYKYDWAKGTLKTIVYIENKHYMISITMDQIHRVWSYPESKSGCVCQ